MTILIKGHVYLGLIACVLYWATLFMLFWGKAHRLWGRLCVGVILPLYLSSLSLGAWQLVVNQKGKGLFAISGLFITLMGICCLYNAFVALRWYRSLSTPILFTPYNLGQLSLSFLFGAYSAFHQNAVNTLLAFVCIPFALIPLLKSRKKVAPKTAIRLHANCMFGVGTTLHTALLAGSGSFILAPWLPSRGLLNWIIPLFIGYLLAFIVFILTKENHNLPLSFSDRSKEIKLRTHLN